MNLKDAYIIDGDVIEKRIVELEEQIKNYEDTDEVYFAELQTELSTLKEILQQAKPALPIVEEAWDKGMKFQIGVQKSDESYNKFTGFEKPNTEMKKQDFLTKDFI